MRWVWLFLPLLLLPSAWALTCTIRSGSCNVDETCLLSLHRRNNTHVGECGYYEYSVCCTDLTSATIRDTACDANEREVLSLYQVNNTEVGIAGFYDYRLCVDWLNCTLRSVCEPNEVCPLSLYQTSRSHVGVCAYYPLKLCCGECDTAQAYCEQCLGPGYWGMGGDVTQCCGDDASEWVINSALGNSTPFEVWVPPASLIACCNASDKCAHPDGCQANWTRYGTTDAWCNGTTWQEIDDSRIFCEAAIGADSWMLGSAQCCGDDGSLDTFINSSSPAWCSYCEEGSAKQNRRPDLPASLTISPGQAAAATGIAVTAQVTDADGDWLQIRVFNSSTKDRLLCAGANVSSGSLSDCTFTAADAGCDEGTCTLYVWTNETIADFCGNLKESESYVTASFFYDPNPPITTDDTDPAEPWYATDRTVTLSCADTGIGCNMTLYCVDTTATCTPNVVGTSVSVLCPSDEVCVQYVRYRSNDTVGNLEGVRTSHRIRIDKKFPRFAYVADDSQGLVTRGVVVNVSTYWSDTVNVSHVIFRTNKTGVWADETWQKWEVTSGWYNTSIDTSGLGGTICWVQWANDTAGNLNQTMQPQCFRVNMPPEWSQAKLLQPSGIVYEPTRNYGFEIKWVDPDGIGIEKVEFVWDGVVYNSTTTPAVQVVGNTYWINFTDLAAGTYSYGWRGRDDVEWNATPSWSFVVSKAPTQITLWLNGSSANRRYCQGDVANLTAAINVSKPIELYSHFDVGLNFVRLNAYWPFEEGVGSVVKDKIGQNDGTVYGATWVDGKFGKALSFDGVDDYIEVPHSNSINPTQVISVEVWIKLPDVTGVHPAVSKYVNTPPYNGYLIEIVDGYAWFTPGGSRAANGVKSVTPIEANKWYYLVGIFDGTKTEDNCMIYVNGKLDNKRTSENLLGNIESLTLGKSPWKWFGGIIDEVYIYNRALTPTEISNLYTLGLKRIATGIEKVQNITLTQPLIGWYTILANWTGDQNYTADEQSWIMEVCEKVPPLWEAVEINTTEPHINESVEIAIDVTDNWYLDTVWLATNETWVWQNRTFRLFHLAGGWVNFTWRNGSIPAGIKVGWQIYFNDSFGNVNATPVRTFEVQIAKTWENFTLDRVWSSAATGDVDADGVLDAVIGAHDGNVYMLEGRRGVRKWNFSTAGYVGSSPSLADLNGDGRLEVYVGSADRRLYALDYDGSLLWNYTTKGVVWSSPAIADVDGDGQNEIIIGSDDNSTYVINATGQQLWNFTTNDTIWSSPVTWKDVIIIASYDRYVYALNGSTREPLWSFAALAQVESTPIVTDVTGDGVPEIAFGSYDRRVYLLDFNGNELWNYTTGGWVTASPNAADLDGDGVAEIIIGSHDSRVYAFKGNGSLLWAFTIPTGGRIESSPSVGDMDLDGDDDVVFGSSDNYVYVVTNEGQLLWSFDTGGYVFSTPALIDLNGDGLLDVVYGNLAATVHALGVPG